MARITPFEDDEYCDPVVFLKKEKIAIEIYPDTSVFIEIEDGKISDT